MSAAEALAPEQSASEVRESLSVTEKGQPANTIGNCRTVFCHDPLLRGAIRLNLLTDRLRQCVFGGSSNTLDFLPLDRAGNRRFLPIMIYPENAEVHILEDEDASRAYLLQVWAEAMTIYRSGHYSMKFSKSIQRQLVEVQKDFMPEDTEAGQIQGFLEHYTGSMVCSKQLFKEALGHTYDEPKRWQLHNINEIMNTVVTGWKPFSNPRMFAGYGRQRGWERDVSGNELPGNEDGFVELTEEECRQLELPKEWIA